MISGVYHTFWRLSIDCWSVPSTFKPSMGEV
nr:MAG TPA: hypothetical protein [Caudoviricetes sp.]